MLDPAFAMQDIHHVLMATGLVVRACDGHCVIVVGQRNNSRIKRNVGAGQTIWVACAIKIFMVMPDDQSNFR